jgi:hypothetical protein
MNSFSPGLIPTYIVGVGLAPTQDLASASIQLGAAIGRNY